MVDLATRSAGGQRDLSDCVLDRNAPQRLTQQFIDIVRYPVVFSGRRHDDDKLSASFGAGGVVTRKRLKITTPDFFVQFGQLAADRGLSFSERYSKVREHCRKA